MFALLWKLKQIFFKLKAEYGDYQLQKSQDEVMQNVQAEDQTTSLFNLFSLPPSKSERESESKLDKEAGTKSKEEVEERQLT